MRRVFSGVAALPVTAVVVLVSVLAVQPGPQPALAITPTPAVPPIKVSAEDLKELAPGQMFSVALDGNAPMLPPGEFSVLSHFQSRLLRLVDCTPAEGFECIKVEAGRVRFSGTRDTKGSFSLGTLEFQAPDYSCETWVELVLENVAGATNEGFLRIQSEAVGPSGDVTCDSIDAIDALLVLQISVFLIGVGDVPYWPNADVNQDGEYNAIDAGLILQKAAGLL